MLAKNRFNITLTLAHLRFRPCQGTEIDAANMLCDTTPVKNIR